MSAKKSNGKSTIKKDTKTNDANLPAIVQLFYTIVGSAPLIAMVAACFYILKNDYAARNNNFWAQSTYFSSINPSDYFEKTSCFESDYKQDRVQFPTCAPKFCGRFFTDSVINDDDTDALLRIAKKGFSYGQSSGGASIFDLDSGVVSMNESFFSVKNMLQEQKKSLLTAGEIKTFNNVREKIITELKLRFHVDNIYLTKPVFFSRITNETAKTMHDEYWHEHIDKKQYEGFHYTTLVYLNCHQREYMGGRFFWWRNEQNTTLSFEPRKNRLSIFTSGSENRHYVEPVLSGIRYAMTIPFTCNQKLAININ